MKNELSVYKTKSIVELKKVLYRILKGAYLETCIRFFKKFILDVLSISIIFT